MRVLEMHYNGKPTYIVGRFVTNGCTTFPIDRLDAVCRKHSVAQHVKQSLLVAYNENSQHPEDYEELTRGDYPDAVKLLCIANGNGVNRCKTSPYWAERRAVIYAGCDPADFKDDPDEDVRIAVIEAGYDPAYFKDDECCYVRLAVLEAGYDPTYFLDDESEVVRLAAKYAAAMLQHDKMRG